MSFTFSLQRSIINKPPTTVTKERRLVHRHRRLLCHSSHTKPETNGGNSTTSWNTCAHLCSCLVHIPGSGCRLRCSSGLRTLVMGLHKDAFAAACWSGSCRLSIHSILSNLTTLRGLEGRRRRRRRGKQRLAWTVIEHCQKKILHSLGPLSTP